MKIFQIATVALVATVCFTSPCRADIERRGDLFPTPFDLELPPVPPVPPIPLHPYDQCIVDANDRFNACVDNALFIEVGCKVLFELPPLRELCLETFFYPAIDSCMALNQEDHAECARIHRPPPQPEPQPEEKSVLEPLPDPNA